MTLSSFCSSNLHCSHKKSSFVAFTEGFDQTFYLISCCHNSKVIDGSKDEITNFKSVYAHFIGFRKLKKLPAKMEARLIEEVKDYRSRYLELEEIIGISSEFRNPLEGRPEISSCDQEWDAANEPYNCSQ